LALVMDVILAWSTWGAALSVEAWRARGDRKPDR
jgi:hypothetical protein